MPVTEALIPFRTALVHPKGAVSSPRSQHHLFSLLASKTPHFFSQVFPIYAPSPASGTATSQHPPHTDPAQITALSTASAGTA